MKMSSFHTGWKRLQSLSGLFGKRKKDKRSHSKKVHERTGRRLVFDPLEQRALLSVVPVAPTTPMGALDPADYYNNRTAVETRHAVAVDGHGDQIVTWVSYDATVGHDRVWVGMYDSNGDPATVTKNGVPTTIQPFEVTSALKTPGGVLLPVGVSTAPMVERTSNNFVTGSTLPTPGGTDPAGRTTNFDQAWASVACDNDGDFVVTWTQYDNVSVTDPLTKVTTTVEDANVYARRFDSVGNSIGDAFRVNTYTANDQLWSVAAMDVSGDFVITWSSVGQEDTDQLGNGYGVYARRYDSAGAPWAPEFQVNVTSGGDQRFSSVSMDSLGGFVVAWTSNQGNQGNQNDHVFARNFDLNGNPTAGPLFGEIQLNQTLVGEQRYPDVACTPDGKNFVATWSSNQNNLTGNSQGWDVYSGRFSRFGTGSGTSATLLVAGTTGAIFDPVIDQKFTTIVASADPMFVSDIAVSLTITDPDTRTLSVWLTSPSGTKVQLFSNVPRQRKSDGTWPSENGNFKGTTFSDAGQVSIDDSDSNKAVVPFTGTFRPEEPLATFAGESAVGTWTLHITDEDAIDGSGQTIDDDALAEVQTLDNWSLNITKSAAIGPEFIVNTTTAGDQQYSSIAMANNGSFTVAWSGNGSQTGQVAQSGVFYQRFDAGGNHLVTPDGVTLGETLMSPPVTGGSISGGNQGLVSVASDDNGSLVGFWTDSTITDRANDTNLVRKFTDQGLYSDGEIIPKPSGPMVVHVLQANASGNSLGQSSILDGGVIQTSAGVQQLLVTFDQDLIQGNVNGFNDVTNPQNWSLRQGNTTISGGVSSVTFLLNPATRKYEATVTFDSNGPRTGAPALPAGNYQLIVRDFIEGASGNALDGDLNGFPGSTNAVDGFVFNFTVATTPQNGAETRVNVSTSSQDTLGQSTATGIARERSNQSVAIDHSGDYAVVWTRYGSIVDPLDPNTATNGDIYMRLFDRNNNPLTGDVLVNTITSGMQQNASVAMDAVGDFVVVWESEEPANPQSPRVPGDVPFRDIHARRFSAKGVALGGQFLVNTQTVNDQYNPTVAMDAYGNFTVAWAAAGQPFSFFNDLHAQQYDDTGRAIGNEFQVNSQNIPGIAVAPGAYEIHPTIAMDYKGDFVVAWDQVDSQLNGILTDSEIIFRLYNPLATALTPETRANKGDSGFITNKEHNPALAAVGGTDEHFKARNPKAAMDSTGNFIVTWEAWQDNDVEPAGTPTSYGIYFRQFYFSQTAAAAAGAPGAITYGVPVSASDQQANMVITTPAPDTAPSPVINSNMFSGDQVNPAIAMDADGDFTLLWDGNGAEPHPTMPSSPAIVTVTNADPQGVWIRNFYSQGVQPAQATQQSVTVQTRANMTQAGNQQFPSVAMTPEGDKIVVWSGNGVGDNHGIFARRYNEPTDTAGPMGIELRLTDGTLVPTDHQLIGSPVRNPNQVVTTNPGKLVVVFDENMYDNLTHTGDAVSNPANYQLASGDGVDISSMITGISFGLNSATNKYEAVLSFSSPLPAGVYKLTAIHPIADISQTANINEGQPGLRDAAGNPLGLTGFTSSAGVNQSFQFIVAPSGSVGSGSDMVVGAGTTYPETSRSVAVAGDGKHVVAWTGTDNRAYVQLYDASGAAFGTAIAVTPEASFAGDQQQYVAVASDRDGDFVVTWTNSHGQDQRIYARRFTAAGGAQGVAFQVNTQTQYKGQWSSAAMSVDGSFIVTWSSFGQEDGNPTSTATGWGVYARRYDALGTPLAPEFRVNLNTAGNQKTPVVAMNSQNGFAIAWTSDQGGNDDIYLRVFNPDGSPVQGSLGNDFRSNQTTDGNQNYPSLAYGFRTNPNIDPLKNSNIQDKILVVSFTGNRGSDAIGNGVYAEVLDVDAFVDNGGVVQSAAFPIRPADQGQFFNNTGGSTIGHIDVNQNLTIQNLVIKISIKHDIPSQLQVDLVSPRGTSVTLFKNVPKAQNGVIPPGVDFTGTTFDDKAAISIDDYAGGAQPPFPGTYRPENPLSAFYGEKTLGTWELRCMDLDPNGGNGTLVDAQIVFSVVPLAEFQVNTSTAGDQQYSSVAMDNLGNFAIGWSGRGDQTQTWQDDTQGTGGVFYQRYDSSANRLGSETRINQILPGNQENVSLGSDSQGNLVAAWTGTNGAGGTNVYKYSSRGFMPTADKAGPMATEVWQGGTRILNGTVLVSSSGVTTMTVVFDSNLSTRLGTDGTPGPDSVLNTSNWVLKRNGTAVPNAINNVTFQLNPVTRKYEATVTLNSLPAGDYALSVLDNVVDPYVPDWHGNPPPYFGLNADGTHVASGGNRLDGDWNGSPGTTLMSTGYSGYGVTFSATDTPASATTLAQYNAEYRINNLTTYDDTISVPYGTGTAQEESTRAVAVDNSGDFAVVWTRYGRDGTSSAANGNGGGVFLRLVKRDNTPLTGEIQVSPGDTGIQGNAGVAVDAVGDVVVTWTSNNPTLSMDGSYDVYARRYSSTGVPLSSGFLVNSETTNDQYNPAVACDPYGNFVVVWATRGLALSYFNDIHGQVYDYNGQRIGNEFQVNSQNLPGTNLVPGSNEVHPAVAMDINGNFVVTWDQNNLQQNGTFIDTNVMGRLFDKFGNPKAIGAVAGVGGSNVEFQVNVGSAGFLSDVSHTAHEAAVGSNANPVAGVGGIQDYKRTARNSQVVMDRAGNFVVAWEAYQDNDSAITVGPESYGVYFRRFNADGTAAAAVDQQANVTVTKPANATSDQGIWQVSDMFAGSQVNPSVAVDANGNIALSWNGTGAQNDPIYSNNSSLVSNIDAAGVFTRTFHAGVTANPVPVPGTPAIIPAAIGPESRVNQTVSGAQQFSSIAMTPGGNGVIVWQGSGAGDPNGIFFRRYTQAADTVGPMGIELRTTLDMVLGTNTPFRSSGLNTIKVIFDEAMYDNLTHTGDAVSNPANYQLLNGGVPVAGGISSVQYALNPLTNKYEATLTFSTPLSGGNYSINLIHPITAANGLSGQSGLRDAKGNPLSRTGAVPGGADATLNFNYLDASPKPLSPDTKDVPISPAAAGSQAQAAAGNQTDPSVATAADGSYVVTWTSTVLGNSDIIGERFDSNGTPMGNPGTPLVKTFAVNTTLAGNQIGSCVAMDTAGDFVVVWSGTGPNTDLLNNTSDVYGQLFGPGGKVGSQFQINQYLPGVQSQPRVAMAGDGTFVVTWTSYGQSGNASAAVFAREYTLAGAPLTNEFQVSAASPLARTLPDVAIDNAYNVVVTWAGDFQDTSTWGVYGKYYNANGLISTELKLNNMTDYRGSFSSLGALDVKSTSPRVSMDNSGNFVVTWANVSNATTGYDIYARRFAAGGTARDANEVLVNTTAPGWQVMPDVAVANNGDYTVVWTSYGQDNAEVNNPALRDYGIYARMYYADGTDYFDSTLQRKPLEYRVNATAVGNQIAPVVDRKGTVSDSVFAWVGPGVPGTSIFSRIVDPPAKVAAVVPKVSVPVPVVPPVVVPVVATISVADVTTQVGTAATQAVFTVTLSAASTKTITMVYGTADGTAKAGIGYTRTAGTLTFSPGQTSKTISVPIAALKSAGLANQTFSLGLTSAVNGKIGRAAATATIVDVVPLPPVVPTVSVGNVTVQVGTAATQAVFTVTLSAATTNTVTMTYGTADGTAKAGIGYTRTAGTLTFSPGQTSKTISVPIAALKSAGLANQTFSLGLTNGVNGKIAVASATATVVDVVPVPVVVPRPVVVVPLPVATVVPAISIGSVIVTRPTTGTAKVTFVVSLSAASTKSITVNYSTINGTALSGSDYTAAIGKLTFAPGVTSQTISVTILANSAKKTAAAFNMALSVPSNATLRASQGTCTINNSVLTILQPAAVNLVLARRLV